MRHIQFRPFAVAIALLMLFSSGSFLAAGPAVQTDRSTVTTRPMGAKKSEKLEAVRARELEAAAGLSASRAAPSAAERDKMLKEQAREKWLAANRPSRPDHLIVKFNNGTQVSEAASVLRTIRGNAVKNFKSGAQLIKLPAGSNLTSVIGALKRTGKVAYAEPDYFLTPDEFIPNDALFTKYLWGMKNTGQTLWGYTGVPGVDIKATYAWDITQGSPDVVVAVIDQGIDFGHPDLASRMWVNPGEICGDGLDNDGNGFVDDCNGWDFYNEDNTTFDPMDGDEHGTHVSGTIAAEINNGIGVAGVAPNVKLMSLKFLGPQGGYTSDAIRAVDYAASFGVKLSNNSWGGGDYEQSLKDAIEASGMLFVAAAGNDAANNDLYPHYPSSYDSENIVAVAAITNDGSMASFSNYGPTSVDIGAPGDLIVSTFPKKAAIPVGIQNNAGSYKTMFWGFGVEDLDPADAQSATQKTMNFFGATTDTKILVVEDDSTGDGSHVHSGLATAFTGYTNVEYLPLASGVNGPASFDPAVYPVVVWATGDAWGNWTGSDLAALTAYLNAGGNLFVTGQDAIFLDELAPLVTDYLGVTWINEDDARKQLLGTAGSIFEGDVLDFAIEGRWRDHVMVTPGHPTAKVALDWMPDPDYSKAYAGWGGTSMATPHVTGVAALLFSLRPDLSAADVKNLILKNARELPSLKDKVVSDGLVDAFMSVNISFDDDVPGLPYPKWGAKVTDKLDGAGFSDLDDVYRVKLRAGQQIRVEMHGALGTDFDLYLFGPGTPTVNDVRYIVAGSEGLTSEEYLQFTALTDGNYYIDAFGYKGAGEYTLKAEWGYGPGCYEENSPALEYKPGWVSVSDGRASGGAYMQANAPDLATSFRFFGNSVELVATKGPDMGLAKILLDDAEQPSADLWSALPAFGQVVYKSGPLDHSVEHTLQFIDAGLRDPNGKKTAIAITVDKVCVYRDTTPPAAIGKLYGYPYDKAVELEWQQTNTEPDFAGYLVYRSEGPTGPWQQLTEKPINASGNGAATAELAKLGLIRPNETTPLPWVEFWDKPVENGKDWYYMVRAVDVAQNLSADSPVVKVHPDPAPAQVAGLGAINGDAQVTLFWDANTEPDVVSYLIFRNGPLDPAGVAYFLAEVPHSDATQLSYQDAGLTNEANYTYLLFAQDKWGVWSDSSASVVGHPSLPPAVPTGFAGGLYPAGIRLTWDENTEPDLDHYQVLIWNSTRGDWDKLGIAPTATYDYATADFSHEYRFGVMAVDQYDVKSAAAKLDFRPPVPQPPKGLTATTGSGAVKLSWIATGEPHVAGYNLYRGTATGALSKINTALITATDYDDTGLTNGTTYYYHVKAQNQMGDESPPSDEVTATPTGDAPGAPTGLTASAGDGQVVLSWTTSPTTTPVDHYALLYATAEGGPWTAVNTTGVVATYTLSSLANGQTYWFKVQAVSSAGSGSEFSNTVYAMPNATGNGAGTYENGNPAVTMTGIWGTSSGSLYSGGSVAYGNSAGASATLIFQGTGVKWVAFKYKVYGIVDVYIDGVKHSSVDLYAPTQQYQPTVLDVTGLTAGVHQIKIVRTGTKNPSATNTYMSLDAFKVE